MRRNFHFQALFVVPVQAHSIKKYISPKIKMRLIWHGSGDGDNFWLVLSEYDRCHRNKPIQLQEEIHGIEHSKARVDRNGFSYWIPTLAPNKSLLHKQIVMQTICFFFTCVSSKTRKSSAGLSEVFSQYCCCCLPIRPTHLFIRSSSIVMTWANTQCSYDTLAHAISSSSVNCFGETDRKGCWRLIHRSE